MPKAQAKATKSLATVTSFLKEVRSELRKVVWPTRAEITRLTAIVVGVSIFTAAYIALLDVSFTKLVDNFILR